MNAVGWRRMLSIVKRFEELRSGKDGQYIAKRKRPSEAASAINGPFAELFSLEIGSFDQVLANPTSACAQVLASGIVQRL